jgi:hypothetical protein
MRRERLENYRRVEQEFLAAEEAVAAAYRASSRLLNIMHETHSALHLDAKTGRAEFASISAVVGSLGQIQERFHEAHEAAVSTRRAALPEVDFGDVGQCNPSAELISRPRRHLRIAG